MCETGIEMPRYKSHKEVWALKIEKIEQSPADLPVDGGSWRITPAEDRYAPFDVTHAWYEKHSPEVGGYYVVYADGYKSYSPAKAFEEGYTPVTSGIAMDFGQAIAALKQGKRVARTGWNGKGMWLVLVPGTPRAELREGTPYRNALGADHCEILPHIDMWTVNAEGRRAMLPGWLASQSDLLATDWQIV